MKRNIAFIFAVLFPATALADERPVLVPERGEIICTDHPDGYSLQIQCDESSDRCLWARTDVSLDGSNGERQVNARDMPFCVPVPPGEWERRVSGGYEMVEASLPARFGYARDERNRLFQTHFDLRRRYFVGVGDTISSDLAQGDAVGQTVRFDVGGRYEAYDRYEAHRHKYRFLEGSVLVAPFEVEGLFFAYDRGRVATEPNLWITTFIGEPRRFDINLDIGPGFHFGRLWYGDVEGSNVALIDLAQAHLNWEFLQSSDLEDYFGIRLGGGIGIGTDPSPDGNVRVYAYPEVALIGALRIGEKGLWEIDGELRGRWGGVVDPLGSWWEVRGAASLERILIAINDQPISIFAEPSVHWHRADYGERFAAQMLIGGRISFFTPAPRPPR